MEPLTIDVIKDDLAATQQDIRNLDKLIEGLSGFINYSNGENRGTFRTDLLKYRSLREQAQTLLANIETALEKLGGK